MNGYYQIESRYQGWPINELLKVLNAVNIYTKKLSDCKEVHIVSVEKFLSEHDNNDRVDIEIIYLQENQLIHQKLLMMKGEIIDGMTFHERFNEFYPGKMVNKS